MRVLIATLATIAALATGAGVLARQTTAPEPQGEQTAGREEPQTKDSGNKSKTVIEAGAIIDDPAGNDEEPADRADTLQIDIELLIDELDSLKKAYSQHVTLDFQLLGGGLGGGRMGPSPERDEQLKATRRLQRENTLNLRETYLEKSKELKRKQRELHKLLGQKQSSVRAQPIRPSGSSTSRSSAAAQAKASPAIEQRVSDIEHKLDEVLKLLNELKR